MNIIVRTLVVAALVAVVAACGRDSEPAATEAPPTATAQPQPTATPTPAPQPTATATPVAAVEEPTPIPATESPLALPAAESPLAPPPESPLPTPAQSGALFSPLPTPSVELQQPLIMFYASRGETPGYYLMTVDGTDIRPVEFPDLSGYRIGALRWVPALKMYLVQMTDASGVPDYYWVDLNGAIVQRVTNDPIDEGDADYSPQTGRIVYVCVQYELDLCSIEANGAGWIPLLTTQARESSPRWSPSGDRLLYTTNGTGVTTIWSMQPDGTDKQNLSGVSMGDDLFPDTNPTWSPDGSRIAFESMRDGNMDIYLMDPDGVNAQNMTANPAEDSRPSWSPDGASIAFVSDRDGVSDIYLMNVDTGEVVNLTNTPDRREINYVWSPDGAMIIFDMEAETGFDIFSVRVDGTGLTNLTNSDDDEMGPQWIGD